ncbi:MAG: Rhomboid protein [Bacteroidota bacterium]|nr:Rhomboid protein [Bacteroidota bacterium]
MSYYKNIWSKRIPVAVFIIYLADYLLGGKIGDYVMLMPSLIISKMEFWRIVSFPLAHGSIEGLILFGFTFYFFAPKLEEFLNRKFFPILLFLMVCLQGIVFTLIFWKQGVQLGGFEGISIFILTLFTLINPRLKIKISNFPYINVAFFTLLILLFWGGTKAMTYINGIGLLEISKSTFSMAFGLASGLFTYLQIYLIDRMNAKKYKQEIPEIPKPEELKLAMMAQSKSQKLNAKLMDEYYKIEIDPSDLNEDKLNEILDKINDRGKDSLTPEELRFLEDYSKIL